MPLPAVLEATVTNPLIALVLCTALLWVGSAVAWEATAPGALPVVAGARRCRLTQH
jgi:hypothetical protein